MRDHFVSGLFVLTPLAVITWILSAVIRALWGLHGILPESWQPENFLQDPSLAVLLRSGFTLGLTLLLALGISILGWASRQYLGKKLLELIAEIIQRIPVVRSIYSALDQMIKAFSSGGGQQFSRVVYLEYPRKGIWALGFVTSPARGPAAPASHLNIFVPTTPNPTGGFHLIVPESDVRESQMSVEDAFKTILSLGVAQPRARGETHGG